MSLDRDVFFMRQAILLAELAAKQGEVPVGAVVVLDDRVIGVGANSPIAQHDPTAHAEVVAMRAAAAQVGNYRLINTTLYVTLEPCMMCAGAMVHARIRRLVYGASDPKSGVISSKAGLLDQDFLNHRVSYEGGVLAPECGTLLSQFFQGRR